MHLRSDTTTHHHSPLPDITILMPLAAGTPAAITERLNQDINRVLKLADVRERMTAEGTLLVGGTAAQFGELVRSEVEKWRRIIQQASIKAGA